MHESFYGTWAKTHEFRDHVTICVLIIKEAIKSRLIQTDCASSAVGNGSTIRPVQRIAVCKYYIITRHYLLVRGVLWLFSVSDKCAKPTAGDTDRSAKIPQQ